MIGGKDYDTNIVFSGIDASVFSAPQTFSIGGNLTGWDVTVSAAFSDPSYSNSFTVSQTNLSGSRYQNSNFPNADGIFFRLLPDTFGGSNLTVTFDMTFDNVSSSLASLDMAVYNGESVDDEIDTITHSGSALELFSQTNLSEVTGSGTGTMTFKDTGTPGGGEFIALTTLTSGDTISWTYDKIGGGSGANMIAMSAVGNPPPVAAVPLPASVLMLVPALGALGAMRRRRRAA